jgi:hypothetical protein
MWFETANRIVAQETVGPFWVSTVFLGLNHEWGGGPPLLYETMVTEGDEWMDRQERYAAREDALAGHRRLVTQLKAVHARREQEKSVPKEDS